METPRNPFILGHRIFRPYFCDRELEQKSLTSAVINGRNVVLISPRRMGKTSLINISMNESDEIRENFIYFFFDILQTNTLKEFTYLIGKSIFDTLVKKNDGKLRNFLNLLKSLQGSFGFDPISGTPTFNIQLGDIRQPEYTLDEIFRFLEQHEKPVVIAIDEFQQVAKYPEKNTEAILRSHIQRLSNASFIFAGSEQSILQEMFVSSKRPFFNSADIMHLNPIAENTYVDFAKELFAEREKSIDETPIRKAFSLFDGNTFYLQQTMNGAFAETGKGKHCGEETVDRTIRSMIAANEVIYREILSNISASQKSTLYAIAKEKSVMNPLSGPFLKRNAISSASSVQNSLQKLSRAGLISKSENGYHLTDPLLRIFINQVYYVPEI